MVPQTATAQSDSHITKILVKDKLKEVVRRGWRQCFLRAACLPLPGVWEGLTELDQLRQNTGSASFPRQR